MKHNHLTRLSVIAALLASLNVQAHDPKEHMKDAENPNCAAMENMDHSKMGKDDPVMQAMMQKCMKDMHDMHKGEGHDMHKGEGHDMHNMHNGDGHGKMSDRKETPKPSKADEHSGHH